MESTAHDFVDNARAGLASPTLQAALAKLKVGFPERRRVAVAKLPEFEALREAGREIKDHVLANLDWYLERFEANVVAAGGQVHWARTPAEAREIVLAICRRHAARSVTKGKTMIAEEIGLNEFLEENGIEPVETDLGEYIIQIRREPPSHIIAPAVHLTKAQIEADFRRLHTALDPRRNLEEPASLVAEARALLRRRYFEADVGITGANFLVAETGTSVIVTNEGNGDLTQLLPKAHVVLASLEKIVPTLEDASTILRLLARSATGQDMSVYTTFSTGPKRRGDLDGPGEYHVVLLDNGRSALLGTEFEEILRCIRCGACMNHCPVYAAVGGHAYGWVYPGPMGAVLTPSLLGVEEAKHLPNASTFCGRCESVCPMKIPLPKMMRHYREREWRRKLSPRAARAGLALWAWLATRPRLYAAVTGVAMRALAFLAGRHGSFFKLPLAGGWTRTREFPAPEGRTFRELWRMRGARASAARDQILAGVRRARGRAALGPDAAAALEARLAGHPRGLIPERSRGLDAAALVDLFERQAKEVSCSVARVASLAEIPDALSRYLASQNLPQEVEMAPDPLLDAVPWAARPLLRIARGRPSGAEGVGVAAGFAGVAETGTLMLASGPTSPATLNFLPDTHVVVLPASRVVGPLEDAWERLRRAGAGPGAAMPRTVNCITGPSRTADVEQKIEMGAHGPRRLHVIIVADPAIG